MNNSDLSNQQRERYARQIMLPELGEAGQRRLLGAKVLIIGAGGLGSPAALYLAAAGLGCIGIADDDSVELSNLQRQVIHANADIGREKALSARDALLALNPEMDVRLHKTRVTEGNAGEIIGAGYDFVLDCTDGFDSKFLINDSCVRMGVPFCHAGIQGFGGQLMTWVPGAPCYRCVFPTPPEGAAEDSPVGVIGALPGVIGSLQAMEAIKFVTGAGELLTGCLLTYDALGAVFRKVNVTRRNGCVCQ